MDQPSSEIRTQLFEKSAMSMAFDSEERQWVLGKTESP